MPKKKTLSKDKARAVKIQRMLKKTYPEVKTQLRHANPFQLLVATILSAQCTDKQVNGVTKELFKKLRTPHDFASVSNEALEALIRPTGYFRNKAKNIKNCSKSLLEKYDGQVPQTLDELVKLPGVGRKTANVVLGSAFNIDGIVVDTHVARISKRLGLTKSNNPVKIEYDLMEIIPKKNWNVFSLQLIYFGRAICKARKPLCPICPIYDLCDFPDKILKPG
ncbi:MAG: endonuclease III [Desulfobacterales bacterium]|jgi:endonuclease-3